MPLANAVVEGLVGRVDATVSGNGSDCDGPGDLRLGWRLRGEPALAPAAAQGAIGKGTRTKWEVDLVD